MTDYTQALCVGQDPELWFERDGTRGRAWALRTCNGAPATDDDPGQEPCPIRLQCLEDAIAAESVGDTRFLHGVVGGLTPLQRARLVTPKCVQCHTPRAKGTRMYCPPCAAKSKAESNARRIRDWAS